MENERLIFGRACLVEVQHEYRGYKGEHDKSKYHKRQENFYWTSTLLEKNENQKQENNPNSCAKWIQENSIQYASCISYRRSIDGLTVVRAHRTPIKCTSNNKEVDINTHTYSRENV